MNKRSSARALAGEGRYGDTELLHVNKAELAAIDSMVPGGLTTNPATGQPEAFSWIPALIAALVNGGVKYATTKDNNDVLPAMITGFLGGGFGGGGASSGAAASGASSAAGAVGAATPGIAPAGAAAGGLGGLGGIWNWVKDHPQLALSGGAMLMSALGGRGDSAAPQPAQDPSTQYHEANPVPRRVVPYSPTQAQPGPSTYISGDTSQDSTPYRYGQGGEHMFFDVAPNSRRPILDNGDETIDIPGIGSFRTPSGGIGGMRRFSGGGLIAGPGNGLSDSVRGVSPSGPLALGDGEFIVPADVVSSLGGGSSRAGAQELSDMMQRVRLQAHGNSQQPQAVDARVMAA